MLFLSGLVRLTLRKVRASYTNPRRREMFSILAILGVFVFGPALLAAWAISYINQ